MDYPAAVSRFVKTAIPYTRVMQPTAAWSKGEKRMLDGCDMIVSLYHLPKMPDTGNVKIKRAFVGDKDKILGFIEKHFHRGWVHEAEHAMMQEVSKCFVATENGQIIGFAAFDGAAKGFFGPIGVEETHRKSNVGAALLICTLNAMREYGYAYAVIGWVGDAEPFYRKTVGAEKIKGGNPENSVYSNMVSL